MNSVFVKVYIKDRNPKQGIGYFTDEGYLSYGYNESEGRYLWTCFNDGYEEHPTWWLEEVKLPMEEEISSYAISSGYINDDSSLGCFKDGSKYILSKLKGGK